MKSFNRGIDLLLVSLSFMAISRSANAYIDPGSGSYLLQMMLALVLAATYTAKSAIKNLVMRVTKRHKPAVEDDSRPHVG